MVLFQNYHSRGVYLKYDNITREALPVRDMCSKVLSIPFDHGQESYLAEHALQLCFTVGYDLLVRSA